MGIYLNPRNTLFQEALEKEIYVDKSLLIEKIYKNARNFNKFICFSRPRRFGKSTDAGMIAAFFSKGCDSRKLFGGLNIAAWEEYGKHMNHYNVIQLNIQEFMSRTHDVEKMKSHMYDEVGQELVQQFEVTDKSGSLDVLLNRCYDKTGEGFIFVIDEWDCIFREFREDVNAQNSYLDYLRLLFKDKPYVKMVYMTGILPIKKYGTHSALNMFDEISMLNAGEYSSFMGFTETEVEYLCNRYEVDFEQMKLWYDGYCMRDGVSTYSPRSVTASITRAEFSNYWSQTETFEALRAYIDLNYEGLKDDIIELLVGKTIKIDILSFQNDMTSFASKDDIYTLLVHLGYLGYIYEDSEIYIPNNEVKDIFITSIKNSNWNYVTKVFQNANALLEATWKGQEQRVADYIADSHFETSILQYNDENALSYTVSLAYITAKQYYTIFRELPAGKGFADIVFLPRKGVNKPAMVIELKWNHNADTGINQIKDKRYYMGLEDYLDNLLLVAISYNKDTKEHTCLIEKWEDRYI